MRVPVKASSNHSEPRHEGGEILEAASPLVVVGEHKSSLRRACIIALVTLAQAISTFARLESGSRQSRQGDTIK